MKPRATVIIAGFLLAVFSSTGPFFCATFETGIAYRHRDSILSDSDATGGCAPSVTSESESMESQGLGTDRTSESDDTKEPLHYIHHKRHHGPPGGYVVDDVVPRVIVPDVRTPSVPTPKVTPPKHYK